MPTSLEVNPAQIAAIGDAVVDLLNCTETSTGESFEAARWFTVEESLESVTGLRVAVFKEAQRRTRATRGSKRIECDLGVAVIRKIGAADDVDLVGDKMLLLAQELAAAVEDNPLTVPGVNQRRLATEIKLLYSPRHLREQRLYVLPTTHTFLLFV